MLCEAGSKSGPRSGPLRGFPTWPLGLEEAAEADLPAILAALASPANPQADEEESMASTIYTAEAHVTGGRANGHGRTSDGVLEVDLRLPAEMGGQGGGTNPEQLFAVGYAACFEGALGVAGRRAKLETGDVGIDSKVSLSPDGKGGFQLSVELDVSLPSVEDAQAAKDLVKAAHQVCPYSNATRGNIEVAITANGEPID
jgi:Ohr subfamily peroxiredoxin